MRVLTLFLLTACSPANESSYPVYSCPADEPLRLAYDPGVDAAWRASTDEAARRWNEALGVETLRSERDASRLSDCLVLVSTTTEPALVAGEAERWGNASGSRRPGAVHVRLDQGMREPLVQLATAQHELGHALGLEHDDEHPSVMRTVVTYYDGPQPEDVQRARLARGVP